MATLDESYSKIADITLWLKIQDGDELMMSDVPSIIPLRWAHFKDNWEFMKQDLIDKIPHNSNPDFFNDQIIEFSKFIDSQRNIGGGAIKINPFADGITFHRFYAIFDAIQIESINLSNEEVDILEAEINRVKAYTKNDFLNARKAIRDYRDRYADICGLSDEDYNKAFGKSSVPKQINATIVENNFMMSLQNTIKTVDFILANLYAVDTALDPFALARANANNPDIDIGQYKSGRLVKMNYGETLEGLAVRYFGDQNKWIDIAIANGLRPPYIDEVGTKILLLSNGNSNQINLPEIDIDGKLNINKFYINQPIFLQSDVEVIPNQRIIVDIFQVPVSGEIVLTLDGEADLNKFLLSENAHVRVYEPNTINSSFLVLIPSSDPLPDNRVEDTPWFLAKSAEDEKRAKIDLAIDSNGEINFLPNGDLRLSYGLENAVQAIKLKLITELGSLRLHPEYGLVNIIGQKNLNIDTLRATIVESINKQISADPRFDRVESLNVTYLVDQDSGGGATGFAISLVVRMAGGNKMIPISFSVSNL